MQEPQKKIRDWAELNRAEKIIASFLIAFGMFLIGLVVFEYVTCWRYGETSIGRTTMELMCISDSSRGNNESRNCKCAQRYGMRPLRPIPKD